MLATQITGKKIAGQYLEVNIMMNEEGPNDEGMTKDEGPNVEGMANEARPKRFDLEERTTRLGRSIISLAKKIKENAITRPLISQLVRAGTSVGANYCEADDAHSKKEFIQKISFCRKESRETKYWLSVVAESNPELKADSLILWQEARELNLIFSAIVNKMKRRLENDELRSPK